MSTLRSALALCCALLLVACGKSASVGNDVGPSPVPKNQYQMANGCYALQSVASNQFLQRQADGGYQLSAAALDMATPFFMKPTGLGDYLLYTEDERFAAANGTAVTTVDAPAEQTVWTIAPQGEDYSVYSAVADKYLGADATLVADAAESQFRFVPASQCAQFPELTTDVDGVTFKGTRSDGSVAGFADVHVHWSSTNFLGGAQHGSPFHRFGVEHAVGDCGGTHGPSGVADVLGAAYGGDVDGHANEGYPEFVDWPGAHALTHEGMYYKWVERAYKAGLRIMVNDLVENRVLCQLVKTVDTANPLGEQGGPGVLCNEMETVHEQIDFMQRLQDYIDAQSGGPDQGWMRIVGSPAEAREVIAEGKLAVVLGVEISHLFNCQVNYNLPVASLPLGPLEGALSGSNNPGEQESELSESFHAYGQDRLGDRLEQTLGTANEKSCTEPGIQAQLDELWDKGVRQLFPVHEFDNAFGGNGIFDGLLLNFGNLLDTGRFWQTYDCPEQDYFYDAGAIMQAVSVAGLCDLAGSPECAQGADLLSPVLDPLGDLLGTLTLPVYGNQKQCNARWMTPMGRFMMDELMKKGIIIEVDHIELEMKSQMLDIADETTPSYPLVSTHGGHGGISTQQAQRMLSSGGIIYPYKPNGEGFSEFYNKLVDVMPNDFPYQMGVGYGADTNGLGAQADPQATAIAYPFTLFEGTDWQGVLGEGIQFEPLTVHMSQVAESGRAFDINSEGQSHYGLVADFVEQIRVTGGNDVLKALYNSAEVYLQMWERTLAASESLRSAKSANQ